MKKIITITSISLMSTALLMGGVLASADEAVVTEPYASKGIVEFKSSQDPTEPLDPTNPDPENPLKPIDPTNPGTSTPGTKGPLSIDFASSLDFGVNKISNTDETYYARAQAYKVVEGKPEQAKTPNYVQVSDNRGTNKGWTLLVKQEGQFTASTPTLNDVLTNAEIQFKEPRVESNSVGVTKPIATSEITLDPFGAATIVMSAKTDAGAGTWLNSWGTVEKVTEKDVNGNNQEVEITKAISLKVPGSTPKDAVKYETTLTWTLTEEPGNEETPGDE